MNICEIEVLAYILVFNIFLAHTHTCTLRHADTHTQPLFCILNLIMTAWGGGICRTYYQ